MAVIGAVGIDRIGDRIKRKARFQPDRIVVDAVAWGRMNKARPGIVCDMITGEQRDLETVAWIEISEWVGAWHTELRKQFGGTYRRFFCNNFTIKLPVCDVGIRKYLLSKFLR